VNIPLFSGETFERPLRSLDNTPQSVSDDSVVRLVASAFARSPLSAEEMRDARIIAFVLDIGSRTPLGAIKPARESHAVVVDDRIAQLTGLSDQRLARGIARLVEARALEQSADDPAHWYRLSPTVVQPAGADQYVDWPAVIPKIAGHSAAILVLRVSLDLVTLPWEWVRLTYDRLATRAAYSLGMAQRGVSQLLEFGVLERAGHLGRGHDYRLSSWALGRGPALIPDETLVQPPPERSAVTSDMSVRVAPKPSSPPAIAGTSAMAVEIGGLVLRVPIGTEIQMTIGPGGQMQYQVGPELKITPRG
jgi:hypothetical protein